MRPASRHWLAGALALAALQAALLVVVARAKGDTYDEHTYIAAGAQEVTHRVISSNPLPAWGFGTAMALSGTLGDVPRLGEGFDPATYLGGDALLARRLFASRLATIAVVVAGGLALGAAARRRGAGVALAAQALWCASPLVLGHGCLATLDPWCAALLAVTLWLAVRFLERPGAGRAALVGLGLALAATSKLPALGALPVALAAGAWAARGRRLPSLAAFLGAFALGVWAACGFDVGPVDLDRAGLAVHLPALPAPSWLRQILSQSYHGFVAGHGNYLAGQTRTTGWWWYYLACLAFQLPLGVQALAVARAATTRRRDLLVDAALLAYPLVIFLVFSAGKTQLGLRYLLPAAPFACFWAARLAELGRAAAIATALLVAAGAVDGLRVHPDYLVYFNAWAGGPDEGTRLLVEGVDWCQDRKLLAEWQARHPDEALYYRPCGAPKSASWGLRSGALECTGARGPGWYALHARQAFAPAKPGCYDWLTARPPDERLGHTVFLWRVDEVTRQRPTGAPWLTTRGQ